MLVAPTVSETQDGRRYYRWPDDGPAHVSVTTALGSVYRYGNWAGFDPLSSIVLTARRRGRAVHRACEILAQGGDLDPESVHPAIAPYVEQFRRFLVDTGFRAIAAELVVRSRLYRYAGRLDLLGQWPPYRDDALGLLDVKTYEDVWLADLQVAAYEEAYREGSQDARSIKSGTLLLSNGDPEDWKLRWLGEPGAFTVFLSALNCFNYADSRGRLSALRMA